MIVNVRLTNAGTDTGPTFNVYYSVNGVDWTLQATGVAKAALTAVQGIDYTVPNGTVYMRITSTGTCTNFINLAVSTTTTTTTSTSTSTSTSTTTSTTTTTTTTAIPEVTINWDFTSDGSLNTHEFVIYKNVSELMVDVNTSQSGSFQAVENDTLNVYMYVDCADTLVNTGQMIVTAQGYQHVDTSSCPGTQTELLNQLVDGNVTVTGYIFYTPPPTTTTTTTTTAAPQEYYKYTPCSNYGSAYFQAGPYPVGTFELTEIVAQTCADCPNGFIIIDVSNTSFGITSVDIFSEGTFGCPTTTTTTTTSTTTTTTSTSTSTTTTTTTTSTTTTDCVYANQVALADTLTPPGTPFISTYNSALSAQYTYFTEEPQPNIGGIAARYNGTIQVNTFFANFEDCQAIPDGYYLSAITSITDPIWHVVNGYLTEILDGNTSTTTTTTTTSIPSYYYPVQLDTNAGTVCVQPSTDTYSDESSFGPGTTLYTDSGLTTPVTGYDYVYYVGPYVREINNSTGTVGVNTIYQCD